MHHDKILTQFFMVLHWKVLSCTHSIQNHIQPSCIVLF